MFKKGVGLQVRQVGPTQPKSKSKKKKKKKRFGMSQTVFTQEKKNY